MLYLNISLNQKQKINNLLENIPKNNLEQIKDILNENGYNFASIRKTDDGGLEIIHNNDYLLLGPLGGIYDAKGKYEKYNCFDYNMDEYDDLLNNDIYNILNGDIEVVNLGN